MSKEKSKTMPMRIFGGLKQVYYEIFASSESLCKILEGQTQYNGIFLAFNVTYILKGSFLRTFSVPAYEITTPYFSDGFGNLLGKRIPQVKTRQRRDTSNPKLKFFKVQAFGRTLHLKVTEAKPKISSEAMIERIETDGRRTYKEIPEGLYYTGQVVSDPGSKVALSGHTGLVSGKSLLKITCSTCNFQLVMPT